MSTKHIRGKSTKILVLNPNSSESMTEGMKTVIDSIDLPYSTEIHTYTAPPYSGSPASINNDQDIWTSSAAVNEHLPEDIEDYDGILVACFSVHPLVHHLLDSLVTTRPRVVVTGIFESAILTALSLVLSPGEKWGIVTTGEFWEEHLTEGVFKFLGSDEDGAATVNSKFAGVESTGLDALDFHYGVHPAVVREKLSMATKRVLRGGETVCIVMGCAGMAGLEEIIRSAASEELGDDFAYSALHVIDGVRAGILQVELMIRHQRLRPGS
ncbi:hypothetical protein F4778DRAFT_612389 [Xylariomycetidae sp. FL2044]|nr:hypothetical protein F4778DRAFT_612389 [Xylariomycetidae sp. FL2044]